jgi:hypothetical protein
MAPKSTALTYIFYLPQQLFSPYTNQHEDRLGRDRATDVDDASAFGSEL